MVVVVQWWGWGWWCEVVAAGGARPPPCTAPWARRRGVARLLGHSCCPLSSRLSLVPVAPDLRHCPAPCSCW